MATRTASALATLCLLAGNPFDPASAQSARPHGILLIVPESDTVVAGTSQYRLSGSTTPGSAVSVNGKPIQVFPSGAFGGALDVAVGENPFTITSAGPSGATAVKNFLIVRPEGPKTTRADTLLIEDTRMEPSSDRWLGDGDVLTVQCKGTPGKKATFMNGLPMRELTPSEAGGVGGIYRGVTRVLETDSMRDVPVTFRLEDASGAAVTARSRGRVSFLPREFPMVGVLKGERPYLNYGLGEDRLGGAKFSFVPAGVRLAIDGRYGGQYRVKLGGAQEAWVPDELVELQPKGTFPPFSITGNITVSADARYDYVALTLGDKLPFSTSQDSDPTRIHVDVYGAMANTNWITHQEAGREIASVSYSQPAARIFRMTITLKHRQMWGYEPSYRGNTLVVKVRRQPEDLDLDRLTIAVDAGHGGGNQGALGSTGAKEKDVTLAIARHLKRELEDEGARVIMTREGDAAGPNSERLRSILASDADLLVSIHANSVGLSSNPLDSKGAGTYYKHPFCKELSVAVLDEVLKSGLNHAGNVGNFNFALNAATEIPSVLVETAFMSHPEDEMKLLDDDFRKELAERIVDGLERFLDECGD
jgi:N-acetylmuramoyl-L-alanine amidase